jgi:hypothetical protein
MPQFTIETTYDLPVYRQVTYEAATVADACELALADDDWSTSKKDYENGHDTRITGVWEGEDAAYKGPAVPLPPEPLIATFDGVRAVVQRHFDGAAAAVLSGLPGDTAPEMQVAIDAALDILTQALLHIRGTPTIPVGTRVRFKRAFEFNYPLSGEVVEGELGTVTKVDGESIWVKLDLRQAQLDEWDNAVQLYDWRVSNNNPLNYHPEGYLEPVNGRDPEL